VVWATLAGLKTGYTWVRSCGSLARNYRGHRSKDRRFRSYCAKMVWGQAVVLFGLASFGAVVLSMVRREPQQRATPSARSSSAHP
jgi:hypothetical protein